MMTVKMSTESVVILFLSIIGSTQEIIFTEVENQPENAVCPSYSYKLTCEVQSVRSITWIGRCHISMGGMSTFSIDNDQVVNLTCTDQGMNYMLFFSFERTASLTVSNVTVVGQSTSRMLLRNSVSVFIACEPASAKEIVMSGPPPPPLNFSYNFNTHICNETHYPVTYTWSHPLLNLSTTSAIIEYILIITKSDEEDMMVLEESKSSVTMWQQYNVTYNISLQSRNCYFTETNSSPSILVSQITSNSCCGLPDEVNPDVCEIKYDPDSMFLTWNCDEPLTSLSNVLQCVCMKISNTSQSCMWLSSKTGTQDTTENSTEQSSVIKTNIIHISAAAASVIFLLFVAVLTFTLIILIRVKISHTKYLFRVNQADSVYTSTPRTSNLNQSFPAAPSVQDGNQQGGHIQYEEIEMRANSHLENDFSADQQYSVLSHQPSQYSSLFGHDRHYSNPTELNKVQWPSTPPEEAS